MKKDQLKYEGGKDSSRQRENNQGAIHYLKELIVAGDEAMERELYELAKEKYQEGISRYISNPLYSKESIQEKIKIADRYQKAINFLVEGKHYYDEEKYELALTFFMQSIDLKKEQAAQFYIEQCQNLINRERVKRDKKDVSLQQKEKSKRGSDEPALNAAIKLKLPPRNKNRPLTFANTRADSSNRNLLQIFVRGNPNKSKQKKKSQGSVNTNVLLVTLVVVILLLVILNVGDRGRAASIHNMERKPEKENYSQDNTSPERIKQVVAHQVIIRDLPGVTMGKIIEIADSSDVVLVLEEKSLISPANAMICVRSTRFKYKSNLEKSVLLKRGKAVVFVGSSNYEGYHNVRVELDENIVEEGIIYARDVKQIGTRKWLKVVHKKSGNSGWILSDFVG